MTVVNRLDLFFVIEEIKVKRAFPHFLWSENQIFKTGFSISILDHTKINSRINENSKKCFFTTPYCIYDNFNIMQIRIRLPIFCHLLQISLFLVRVLSNTKLQEIPVPWIRNVRTVLHKDIELGCSLAEGFLANDTERYKESYTKKLKRMKSFAICSYCVLTYIFNWQLTNTFSWFYA